MAGGALGVGTADVPLGRKEATGDSAALLRAPICHAQSPCGQAAAAGAAHAPLEGAGALSGEAEGETAALLHGPPSAAHAPGAPRSAGGRAGLGGAALELEGGGEQVDGRAVVARVHWHILPLFFLLALLCSVDRGARPAGAPAAPECRPPRRACLPCLQRRRAVALLGEGRRPGGPIRVRRRSAKRGPSMCGASGLTARVPRRGQPTCRSRPCSSTRTSASRAPSLVSAQVRALLPPEAACALSWAPPAGATSRGQHGAGPMPGVNAG
jgi:hypothetical protein